MATENRSLQIQAKLQDQASAGFAKLLSAGRGAAGGLVTAFKGVGIAIGAISAASVAGFVAFKRVADDLDKVAKASDRLGVSAESLTSLRYGAELAGVGFEELVASVRQFEKVVEEANEGGAKQRDLLTDLGLTSSQFAGEQLDLVDVLGRVGDGINSLGSATSKTTALMRLFGDQGVALAPLLQQGSAGISKLAQEARSLGVVFSREELARVEAFNDSWTALRQSFDALAQKITIELAPAFTELFETMKEWLSTNSKEIRVAFLDLIGTFVEGFRVLNYVFDSMKLIATGWQLIIKSLSQTTAEIIGNKDAAYLLSREIEALNTNAKLLQKNFGSASVELDKMQARLTDLRAVAAQPIRITVVADGIPDSTAWDSFAEGANRAIAAWSDFNSAVSQGAFRFINTSLDNLTNTIADGVTRTKTWTQAWKDLGAQTLRILAQIITKLAIVRTLNLLVNAFSGGSGGGSLTAQANGGVEQGGIKSTLPLQRFAMGGIAKGPTLALMGEGSAPAEAFVPLPDGKSIPVSFSGGGGGGQTIVINQEFRSFDAKGAYELLKANRGVLRQFAIDDMQRRSATRGAVQGAAR